MKQTSYRVKVQFRHFLAPYDTLNKNKFKCNTPLSIKLDKPACSTLVRRVNITAAFKTRIEIPRVLLQCIILSAVALKIRDYIYSRSFKRDRHEIVPLYILITVTITLAPPK